MLCRLYLRLEFDYYTCINVQFLQVKLFYLEQYLLRCLPVKDLTIEVQNLVWSVYQSLCEA